MTEPITKGVEMPRMGRREFARRANADQVRVFLRRLRAERREGRDWVPSARIAGVGVASLRDRNRGK